MEIRSPLPEEAILNVDSSPRGSPTKSWPCVDIQRLFSNLSVRKKPIESVSVASVQPVTSCSSLLSSHFTEYTKKAKSSPSSPRLIAKLFVSYSLVSKMSSQNEISRLNRKTRMTLLSGFFEEATRKVPSDERITRWPNPCDELTPVIGEFRPTVEVVPLSSRYSKTVAIPPSTADLSKPTAPIAIVMAGPDSASETEEPNSSPTLGGLGTCRSRRVHRVSWFCCLNSCTRPRLSE
mmetsp:Transcript_29274/g.80409  ORF Transcript_29274/g.80409 Transcript_29274/m.80409 type:complete len:236 (-) Transcript_29274:3126-3833(-)